MATAPARRPRPLDLATWPRRHHFEFFRGYDQPFFDVAVPVDVTELVACCRQPGGPSFFLASLWLSLVAVNAVEELRYRLRGDGAVVYDEIDGGSTVLRSDDTFAFAYFAFAPRFAEFAGPAAVERDRVRRGTGALEPRPERDDLVHYSILPWLEFTSFAHARRHDPADSVPKIVFGRHHARGARRLMPVSVAVHHALADGLHVGRFFDRFEELLARAPAALAGEI